MNQRKINILIVFLVTLLFLVVYLNQAILINGPGESAVIFKPFNGGIDKKIVMKEGVFVIWPWNTAYRFSNREKLVNDTLNIIVKNGVTLSVRVNYRYYPIIDSLAIIFSKFGENYVDVFVKPEVLYAVHERFASRNPEEIYSLELDSLKIESQKSSLDRVIKGNVLISDVLILDIKLPIHIVEAIENKLRDEELCKQYDFKITIAEKEKKIKLIEAQAIKITQDTINSGLTNKFLQFKQIDAIQKLSISPNAKTIIIPNGNKSQILLSAQ